MPEKHGSFRRKHSRRRGTKYLASIITKYPIPAKKGNMSNMNERIPPIVNYINNNPL